MINQRFLGGEDKDKQLNFELHEKYALFQLKVLINEIAKQLLQPHPKLNKRAKIAFLGFH